LTAKCLTQLFQLLVEKFKKVCFFDFFSCGIIFFSSNSIVSQHFISLLATPHSFVELGISYFAKLNKKAEQYFKQLNGRKSSDCGVAGKGENY